MTDAGRIEYLERSLLELAKDVAKGNAGKISAIKAYRAATGMTLKDSKDWVESHEARPPVDDSRIQRLEDRVTILERGRGLSLGQ